MTSRLPILKGSFWPYKPVYHRDLVKLPLKREVKICSRLPFGDVLWRCWDTGWLIRLIGVCNFVVFVYPGAGKMV